MKILFILMMSINIMAQSQNVAPGEGGNGPGNNGDPDGALYTKFLEQAIHIINEGHIFSPEEMGYFHGYGAKDISELRIDIVSDRLCRDSQPHCDEIDSLLGKYIKEGANDVIKVNRNRLKNAVYYEILENAGHEYLLASGHEKTANYKFSSRINELRKDNIIYSDTCELIIHEEMNDFKTNALVEKLINNGFYIVRHPSTLNAHFINARVVKKTISKNMISKDYSAKGFLELSIFYGNGSRSRRASVLNTSFSSSNVKLLKYRANNNKLMNRFSYKETNINLDQVNLFSCVLI